MPVIIIRMAKGRPTDTKRKLVRDVTAVAVETLDVRPEWITVLIEEYDRENWATGGELHSDKLGAGHGKQGSTE